MPRSRTPISEQIAKAKTEIRQNENRLKEQLQKKTLLERNARTRRLIERGAITESLINGADTLTNDQVKQLLQSALSTTAAREMLAAFLNGAALTQAAQAD
jgi:hypothetical protein